ncbi:DUF6415 family natural product biosynthesis protein [Streptomyces sp. NPDC002742]|uniref:DUF6415 family natural product biosynthesis protein n=1 Tax=Streptomyces sp. NPDC002742 TaxID=3364663 RepID=UPI0036B56903
MANADKERRRYAKYSQPAIGREADGCPPDIALMRSSVRRFLAEDSLPPSAHELETLTLRLRGHMHLLIPEVEQMIAGLPKDDIPRYCALACIGEARRKLNISAQPGISSGIAHARRLARSLNALCDHYEKFTGDRS